MEGSDAEADSIGCTKVRESHVGDLGCRLDMLGWSSGLAWVGGHSDIPVLAVAVGDGSPAAAEENEEQVED